MTRIRNYFFFCLILILQIYTLVITSCEDKDTAGTPVYAVSDGNISASMRASDYGWVMIIDHPQDNIYSLCGHLSTRRWKRQDGQVNKGDIIAYLGDEGEISFPGTLLFTHLHFGIRSGSRYDYPGDSSDERWTAGYSFAHPTVLGWLDPSDYILSHSE